MPQNDVTKANDSVEKSAMDNSKHSRNDSFVIPGARVPSMFSRVKESMKRNNDVIGVGYANLDT